MLIVAPSLAPAVAARGMVAPELYVEPAAGLVSATVGALCAPVQSVPLIEKDVGLAFVPL
ncbi:MAG: hypothetical protein ACJ72W_05910 [Actinoallomurus sp.]